MRSHAMTCEELLGALSPAELVNAPPHFFLCGDSTLLSSGPRVAIVGTYAPTGNGYGATWGYAAELVERGVVVVSDLTPGIGNAAHIEAIDSGGRTIAVLATSLNECYPSDNYELQHEIKSENLVISQFPEVTRATWGSRVKRSQTMALISHATIIIQAEADSEALEQGMEALRLRRPVFIAEQAFEVPDYSWVTKLIDRGASMLAFSTIHRLWDSIGLPRELAGRADEMAEAKDLSGQERVAVDPQGRVAIPGSARGSSGVVVLCPGPGKRILVFPKERYEAVISSADTALHEPGARRHLRAHMSQAYEIVLDAQSRARIPSELLEAAWISDQALLVGAGDHFELLAPDSDGLFPR